EDGLSVAGPNAVHLPYQLRFALRHRARVQADDLAIGTAAVVLLAVSNPDPVALDHRGTVDRSFAEYVAPHLLAGGHLEGMHSAIAAAADQQALPGDVGHHGDGGVGVVDAVVGGPPPDHGAVVLVEGDEAGAADGLLAP